MTRTYALCRLLSLGPCTLDELILECGWPIDELRALLQELRNAGAVKVASDGRAQRVYRLA